MKKWMNWIITLLTIAVIFSGVTIVFALGNESISHRNDPLAQTVETNEIKETNETSGLYASEIPYKIQSGDSLWKLTSSYSGSLSRQDVILKIMAYNNLTDASKLQIHHVIYLPGCLSLGD